MSDKNTFGDYTFDDWVPDDVQEMIRNFWGCFGRTYEDWLEDSKVQDERQVCYHIPCAGFGIPPYGAEVFVYRRKFQSNDLEVLRGRYIHRWNNMGSIISDGMSRTVSSCDPWVRILTRDEAEKLFPNG